MKSINSFNSEQILKVDNQNYQYFDLKTVSNNFGLNLNEVPISIKIILENLLRNEDGYIINSKMISSVFESLKNKHQSNSLEIAFFPTRVLMQDFTGVPAVADLAAMRNALKKRGIEPKIINPLSRVDLVIDHSVMVDKYRDQNALSENVKIEFERNKERYEFLKWGQNSFDNFYLVPPGAGICHQVNLENIAKTIWSKTIDGKKYVFPDSVVGTDSHTTMVNALSVLGWGVGGIEAEAAMLGQPISMNIPDVVGFELIGSLNEGITATDLVLTITQTLRNNGVVGKFVEFFGKGLSNLSLADRATISNMAPEYGATCGFFPTDQETINYLKLTGKNDQHLDLVKKYSKTQLMWLDDSYNPNFSKKIVLDLDTIEASLAGPKRPQDKILLKNVPDTFKNFDKNTSVINNAKLKKGDIVIAAITSCTNTSNPNVMLASGLVAKRAIELNLKVKPWVKTSLAPGSKVVSDYLNAAGLTKYLNELGFNTVGYGCTTCIGNSGPLDEWISDEINSNNLTVCSVLSGNRNFEGRVHQDVKANFLASPPLVVAYAIAGNININLIKEPLGKTNEGKDVYLKDLWPSNFEINSLLNKCLSPEMFKSRYKEIYEGDENWKSISSNNDMTYNWSDTSTYIKHPPFFDDNNNSKVLSDIKKARILAILGDSVTTDHISPAGSIKEESPAGKYLNNRQINRLNFNSYGSRRGNHEVMMRGTFANIRIKNEIVPETEGGYTKSFITNKLMSIYDASQEYVKNNVDTVVIAGKEYGTGSSRDWAAKGTKLLGIKAVIAESFERIHRSNLIGMGVLPLEFTENVNRINLGLKGDETITITGLKELSPNKLLKCKIEGKDTLEINLKCRIDTNKELDYYKAGGILNFVLNEIIMNAA